MATDVEVKKDGGAPAVPPVASLRDEIDNVFDRFIGGSWPFGGGLGRLAATDPFRTLRASAGTGTSMPRADLSETDDGYEFTVDVPGMSDKDIDVTLDDGMLTVHCKREDEKETREKNYHLLERSYGEQRRTIALPRGVDSDAISAKVTNGVLAVSLPKSAEAKQQARRISVNAG